MSATASAFSGRTCSSRTPRPPLGGLGHFKPPYIPSAEIDKLEPEVLKEPRLALDGGKDGLQALKAIVGEVSATSARAGGWSWKSAPTRESGRHGFSGESGAGGSGPCARTCRGGTASSPEK